MDNKRFLVPVLTPTKEDGSVNYDALGKHVENVLKEGANGIYAGGSSAEFLMLTETERKKTLEAVIEAAKGAFVVAHIGSVGTRQAIEYARHAQSVGADAIASIPPFYYGFSFEEVKSYYFDLAESTDLPLMLYNIPSSTGVKLTVEQMAELLSHKKIPYMKFTDYDYYAMDHIKTRVNKFIYSGSDERFLSALSMGADGAIGTTFNFMMKKFIRIYNLFKENKLAEALKVQHSANIIIEALIKHGLLDGSKFLSSLKGVDMGHSYRPFRRLSEEGVRALEKIVEKEGLE